MSAALGPVVSCAVEGAIDEAVLTRLLAHCQLTRGPLHVKRGKPKLRTKLEGYNNAARFGLWVVLVDLDGDAECVVDFVRDWLPAPSPGMRFRVAVRQVESWLLADRERLAEALGVRRGLLPTHPESVPDAKREMVNIARRSRTPVVREEMVPRSGSGRSTGPAYPARLIEFVLTRWRPEIAAQRSESLERCLRRLRELPAPVANATR